MVISDYMMPGVNGVGFLSEVRQTFPDTIRLMLSGQADMSVVIDAINDGSIVKFVLKPWSNDGLRRLNSEAFEKRAEQSEQQDDEPGWLSQSRFLDQEIEGLAGAILMVGEWVEWSLRIANTNPSLIHQFNGAGRRENVIKRQPV